MQTRPYPTLKRLALLLTLGLSLWGAPAEARPAGLGMERGTWAIVGHAHSDQEAQWVERGKCWRRGRRTVACTYTLHGVSFGEKLEAGTWVPMVGDLETLIVARRCKTGRVRTWEPLGSDPPCH